MNFKIFVLLICVVITSCKGKTSKEILDEAQRPEVIHIKNLPVEEKNVNQIDSTVISLNEKSIVYQLNIRQFTKEGTIKEAESHLKRLKDLGVDLIQLPPINPIGKINRQGDLGNFNSINDFNSFNPEFGTIENFKSFLNKAHSLGIKVVIGWVLQDTSKDNVWLNEDRLLYKIDSVTGMVLPNPNNVWDDTILLDYSNQKTCDYMLKALLFWVNKVGVDGFRFNNHTNVPNEFFTRFKEQLSDNRSVILISSRIDDFDNQRWFDIIEDNQLFTLLDGVGKRIISTIDLKKYVELRDSLNYEQKYINYTSNYNINSFNRSVLKRYKKNTKNLATLLFTLNGMPMIYSGQEVGNSRSLKPFSKDSINWNNDINAFHIHYEKLIDVYKKTPQIWNSITRDNIEFIDSKNKNVLIFKRKLKNYNSVSVIVNLTGKNYWMPIKVANQIVPDSLNVNVLFGDEFITEKGNFYVPPYQGRIITY